ncbi:PEP-CTERM sorting domain-containing protein [Aestuariibacter salexigens]|uniref:PEP-CTERM sorting domain-containing protein n=1 Tax=Aestuariibacter salexigens TaxID=226010 RepID=UPI00047B71C7|nr:PEP-CTERM sorting domain-containing protein [Aestuariibacter salexigens]
MKNILASLTLLFIFSVNANATIITVQLGDMDGFGIGVIPNESFDFSSVVPDGDGTDTWVYGQQNFVLAYSLSGLGAIQSAVLEIFTGGQGFLDLTGVFLDGQSIGTLTDGDDNGNFARLDIFNLASFIGLLDGSDTVNLAVSSGSDGWVLDYIKLTITTRDADDVPEPATLGLLGLALLGMRRLRRS